MRERHAALLTRRSLGSERALTGAAIAAVGVALPDRVIENAPIAERLGVDDDWIASRTGISARHALRPGSRRSTARRSLG